MAIASLFLTALPSVALAVPSARREQARDCCKRKAICCCKKRGGESGPELWSTEDCARRCSLPVVQTPKWSAERAGDPAFERESHERASVVTEAAGHVSFYLAFLYQRPPPSL